MAKEAKVFTIRGTYSGFRERAPRLVTGTLEELKKYFKYTLECGQSWQREKGNYKINIDPKSIKSLVSSLNKAEHNTGRSFQAWYYELVEA